MLENDLSVHIEKLRKKMISVGMSNGFTSAETIQLSRKLDYLINLQMRKRRKIPA